MRIMQNVTLYLRLIRICNILKPVRIISLFCLVSASLVAAVPYTPEYGDPFADSWRWTRIEALGDQAVLCMFEMPDSSYYIGLPNSIARYDGYALIRYPIPDSLPQVRIFDIISESKDQLLLRGDALIYRFRNHRFELMDLPVSFIAGGNFLQTSDGSIWIGSSGGFVRFDGDSVLCYRPEGVYDLRIAGRDAEFVRFAQDTSFDVTSVTYEPDESLLIGLYGGQTLRVGFKSGRVAPASTWEPWRKLPHLTTGAGRVTYHSRDQKIWMMNTTETQPLLIYDQSTQEEHVVDFRHIGGSNAGFSLIELQDGCMLISGHSALHLLKNGSWRVYKRPDYPLPQGFIRLVQGRDGTLWVLGISSGGLTRIDLGNASWMTLKHLHFQCEDGEQRAWFLSRTGEAVLHDPRSDAWQAYAVGDGLINQAVTLFYSQNHGLWAIGSHEDASAAAWFRDGRWHRKVFPNFSTHIDFRSICESPDGCLWFGAGGNIFWKEGLFGGLLRHDPHAKPDDAWKIFSVPHGPERPAGLACTQSGRLYFGGQYFSAFQDERLVRLTEKHEFLSSWWDDVEVTAEDKIWAAKGGAGIFHFDGRQWASFGKQDGLASAMTTALLADRDGSIWAGTDQGISRYDGHAWLTYALPKEIAMPRESGSIKQSGEGAIWINKAPRTWYFRAFIKKIGESPRDDFYTIRYFPDHLPPETQIDVYQEKIPASGRLFVAWQGIDRWQVSKTEELQFSTRLDGEAWSLFSDKKQELLFDLKSGHHTFQVRARDRDLNVDPTPATVSFFVEYPVWMKPWFILLIGLLIGVVVAQYFRIVRRDQYLQEVNMNLAAKSRNLEIANHEVEAQKEVLIRTSSEIEAANRELKRTSDALRNSNEELQQFAYVASHDLQEPLRMVASYLALLTRRLSGQLDEDSQVFINYAVDGARRMQNLITDLLEYSRISTQAKPPEEVDCSKLLEQVLLNLQVAVQESDADVYVESLPVVVAEPTQLMRLFQNLIGNAVKYRGDRNPEILISCETAKGFHHFKIMDNGIGIDPEYREKVFGIFQRLHGRDEYAGTGIGLAVCKKIVERHGGKIWVESGVENGAAFHFTLPVSST